MGDQDELGALGQVAQICRETVYVDLVKRRLDFVHHAEGRRTNLHDREVQRDRDKRFFTAGERLQMDDDLARRMDDDIDARGEDILGIGELEVRLAAAKELLECQGEVLVDLGEGIDEHLFHLLGQVGDQVLDLFLGLFDVVNLRFHKGVSLGYLFVFLDRAGVDRTEGSDLVFEGAQTRARLGEILDLDRLLLRLVAGQLVLLPELRDNIVKLLLLARLALLESGEFIGGELALSGLVTLELSE